MNRRRGVVTSVLLAAALLAAPAHAYRPCSPPSRPSLPSGLSAQAADISTARGEVERYQQAVRSFRQCLQANDAEAEQESARVTADWNRELNVYGSR